MSKGALVIVGGKFRRSNLAAYHTFIKLAGGTEQAKIGIVPAASIRPLKYYSLFKEDLIHLGVPPDNIDLIKIGVQGNHIPEGEETAWKHNAEKQDVAEAIRRYTGIWFLGGDQRWITRALLRQDGSATPALDAMWDVYHQGGVLGGTSAGAAMMSEIMMSGGDSLGALKYGCREYYQDINEQEFGPVTIMKGLGFFQYGIIDQHFDRLARLGRLIVANCAYKHEYPLGFGVDEDTAFIIYNDRKKAEVIGTGHVTVVDVSNAENAQNRKMTSIKNVVLSFMADGDMYDFETGEMTVSPERAGAGIVGNESFEVETHPMVTGVFSRNALIKNFVTCDLLDNKNANAVTSYCFGSDGIGFELIFRKTEESKGYWGYVDGLMDTYSAFNIALDIVPVQVNITPLPEE